MVGVSKALGKCPSFETCREPGFDFFIILQQLDKQLEPIDDGTYKLVGASLRNIEAIDYQIATGSGTIVEITTTIAYHYYEVI